MCPIDLYVHVHTVHRRRGQILPRPGVWVRSHPEATCTNILNNENTFFRFKTSMVHVIMAYLNQFDSSIITEHAGIKKNETPFC